MTRMARSTLLLLFKVGRQCLAGGVTWNLPGGMDVHVCLTQRLAMVVTSVFFWLSASVSMVVCLQAIRVMRRQKSGGHIFVMDGAGADGNATPRFAAYGATKRSLAQFIKSLQVTLPPPLFSSHLCLSRASPGAPEQNSDWSP